MSALSSDLLAPRTPRLVRFGNSEGLLLGGPPAAEGAESLDRHLARLGPAPMLSSDAMLSEVRASGLQGRGGGSFPLARKLETALRSPGQPLLVVNCSESEPASRKDRVICSSRPHVVLEGAAAIAKVLGAGEAVIHLHGSSTEMVSALRVALAERRSVSGDPQWQLSRGPGGYVAGESSAVARFVHSGVALPSFSSIPLAHRGPSGRPTVVSNAETAAHVAFIVRRGAARWREAGTDSCPGPQLLTVTGAVPEPGTVVELVGVATIGEVLMAAGVTSAPQAVLVGGYAGSWVRGDVAWHTDMEPSALDRLGAERGCGLLAVLPHGACGLVETARIVRYLAGESAGQCGPCVHGLPVLADGMEALARGDGVRRALRRLRRTAEALPGSGACRHPDGVVRLVASTLKVFAVDLIRHRAGTTCPESNRGPAFPLAPAGDSS